MRSADVAAGARMPAAGLDARRVIEGETSTILGTLPSIVVRSVTLPATIRPNTGEMPAWFPCNSIRQAGHRRGRYARYLADGGWYIPTD
jgi:hypothetical protein